MAVLAYFSCLLLIAAQPSVETEDLEMEEFGDDNWGDDDWEDVPLKPIKPTIMPEAIENKFSQNNSISDPGDGWKDMSEQPQNETLTSQKNQHYSSAHPSPSTITPSAKGKRYHNKT